jgi:mutator protein MutT
MATPHSEKRVVAAVIERGEAVLICRRPEGKNHGGLWGFPGGKMAPGESVAEAVARELNEELNVQTESVTDVLFSVTDELSGYQIHFVPATISGEPTALEHSAIAWCDRKDLSNYALAPSDREFAIFLMGA